MKIIEEFLKKDDADKQLKIGVVGDAMLDMYYDVHIKKISPEFPIPVMASLCDMPEILPGGAANVAYQLTNFNVNASLISFLDTEAASLLDIFRIENSGIIIENNIPRKKRFYSDNIPTYRWDVEQERYGLEKYLQIYQNRLFDFDAEKYDVIIYSDYDKGVFSDFKNNLIPKNKITIVDPKNGNIDRWKNCTIFKPNKQEAFFLSNKNNIEDAGKYLLDRLRCQAVIITQAGDGVSVFGTDGIQHIKPQKRLSHATSVIGAGDCFTAILGIAVGRGFSMKDAAEIAWHGGNLYVKNLHNKPLSKIDFLNLIGKKMVQPESLKKRNFSLVFTNGCFDIFHAGHLSTLEYAKKFGDKLVVALNSDESVSKLKKGRPFIELKDRMKLISALECVDYVVSFNQETPEELIKTIKPDYIVKGGDYQGKTIIGADIVKNVFIAPMVDGLSTTKLVEKIRN